MKKELKNMLDFWKEQHENNQYFDCKDNYEDDLLNKYKNGSDESLISMGLKDGLWGSDSNSAQAYFDIARHGSEMKVLEIGCGYGGFGASIAKYVDQYDGVDISQKIVDNGNSSIKNVGIKNMNLYCAEDCNLSFIKDKSYDIIFSTAVFIHTEEDVTQHYLKETARLLKDDGFFIHHLNVTSDSTINNFYNKIYNIDECNDLFANNNLRIISNRDGLYFQNNCFMRYYIGNSL
jgi:ubiquinone/menaquinone biosynthesis C-methylase UbiE